MTSLNLCDPMDALADAAPSPAVMTVNAAPASFFETPAPLSAPSSAPADVAAPARETSLLGRLRDEMFFAAWSMHNLIHDVASPACQHNGVTVQQMHVLAELAREPGLTVGTLSDRTGILRTNFAAVCRKLEERGLVERGSKDGDRRARTLHVTAEGRAVLESVEREIVTRLESSFHEVHPQVVHDALSGIHSINTLLRQMGR